MYDILTLLDHVDNPSMPDHFILRVLLNKLKQINQTRKSIDIFELV